MSELSPPYNLLFFHYTINQVMSGSKYQPREPIPAPFALRILSFRCYYNSNLSIVFRLLHTVWSQLFPPPPRNLRRITKTGSISRRHIVSDFGETCEVEFPTSSPLQGPFLAPVYFLLHTSPSLVTPSHVPIYFSSGTNCWPQGG